MHQYSQKRKSMNNFLETLLKILSRKIKTSLKESRFLVAKNYQKC